MKKELVWEREVGMGREHCRNVIVNIMTCATCRVSRIES